ncbi:MAG: shikimate dehydrogenase [Bacteroidales bacterium]|nr:shikimate dehydrogenase [Bacteroidales bacterium]
MRRFGLIGHPLGHSFSQAYFNEKFTNEHLDCIYQNFDLESIGLLGKLVSENPDLKGLNITIPYKEAVLPFLDELDETANEVKAVNTVKVLNNGKLKGFNTDVIGFEETLASLPFSKNISSFVERKAIILGTGGASKAVQYVLHKHSIEFQTVSRNSRRGDLTYKMLTPEIVKDRLLIVNTTPLGTHPNMDEAPYLPYETITPNHTLIDLIYNPEETLFLRRGKQQGALTINGLTMLYAQAEASWKIWNTNL